MNSEKNFSGNPEFPEIKRECLKNKERTESIEKNELSLASTASGTITKTDGAAEIHAETNGIK